ncbi:hypothetical protein PPGU19_026090 [Paraburkholderia sp. PGU19]|uniref:hypothetical protein n=1 Tax=Paraburkholderia sp. PGU19 TaxID=2735434 RepID=UPI0015D988DA|nr:hypothetical protein [Paraburkholderia sp. PGU19]BCF98040.1 hypothetical protein PPGU19_026090 [Paraburkholderia sp. PGU19]
MKRSGPGRVDRAAAGGAVFAHNALDIQAVRSKMRISLLACLSAALFALPLVSIAVPSSVPVSMRGSADSGDTVELRFDSPPSKTATLLIKGDRTGSAPKTVSCTYELEPIQKGALESPIVKITFNDRQTMTIACDPLSDNCHADSYPTVGGTSFSMLWHITRADVQSAHTKTRLRQ